MSNEELQALRSRIDALDEAWIEVLARRFDTTRRVGELKARSGAPAQDATREAEQRRRIALLAEAAGIPDGVAERVLDAILSAVVEEHRRTGAR